MNDIKLKKRLNQWFLLSIFSFFLVVAFLAFADEFSDIVSISNSSVHDYIVIFLVSFFGLSPAVFSVGTVLYSARGYSRRLIKIMSFDAMKCLVATFIVSIYVLLIVINIHRVEPEMGSERKRLTIEDIENETTGTVKYMDFEGGFWGIVGDNGGSYDAGNLPEEFKVDGMRVRFKASVVPNVGSFHMWGTIVRIERIEKLD